MDNRHTHFMVMKYHLHPLSLIWAYPSIQAVLMDCSTLFLHNTSKAIRSMHALSSLGLNASGFKRLLSIRLYEQFVRPQLEYGLAIQVLRKPDLKDWKMPSLLVYGKYFAHGQTAQPKLCTILLICPRCTIVPPRFKPSSSYAVPNCQLMHFFTIFVKLQCKSHRAIYPNY